MATTIKEALAEMPELMEEDLPQAQERMTNILECLHNDYGLEYDFQKACDEIEEENTTSYCPDCSGSGEGPADGTTCSRCKGMGQ